MASMRDTASAYASDRLAFLLRQRRGKLGEGAEVLPSARVERPPSEKPPTLLMPQRLDRVLARGLPAGVDAEEDAYSGRDAVAARGSASALLLNWHECQVVKVQSLSIDIRQPDRVQARCELNRCDPSLAVAAHPMRPVVHGRPSEAAARRETHA